MADKYQGPLIAGSISNSVTIVLRSATDGSEVLSKVAADMTAAYWRQGGTPTAIALSDLALITSGYASGGVKEASAALMPGTYRLDLPDAAVAAGVEWVQLAVKVSGSLVFNERYPIASAGAGQVNTLLLVVQTAVTAIKAITDTIVVVGGKVSAAITTSGDFVQGAADRVWASASRTLSAFGFTVNLASNPFDDLASSHNIANTLGAKLNAAGSASDPLANSVPGTYVAGTAGFTLGNIANNTAAITAIGNVTSQFRFTTPNVVDSSAASGLTTAAITAAVWSKIVETQGNITAQQALDTILAVVAGVTSIDGLTFRTPDGTQIRAVVTTDAQTNRLTVILTPSA